MMNEQAGTLAASRRTRRVAAGVGEEARRTVTNFWARNQAELIELNFNWTVENFSLQPTDDYIQSPLFFSHRYCAIY
jgi:hypothetical protein